MKNLRQIKVKFLGPTNSSGSRIKIYEPKRSKDATTESKTFPYDYSIGDIKAQAIKILEANNWEVICTASEYENYIILCDNWGEYYNSISDLI